MAPRPKTENGTAPKRTRRSPEQQIADLQAKIEQVKARAAAKEAKADPEAKALITAAKVLDKAAGGCTGDVKRALEAARAILAEQMVRMGIRASQPKRVRAA